MLNSLFYHDHLQISGLTGYPRVYHIQPSMNKFFRLRREHYARISGLNLKIVRKG